MRADCSDTYSSEGKVSAAAVKHTATILEACARACPYKPCVWHIKRGRLRKSRIDLLYEYSSQMRGEANERGSVLESVRQKRTVITLLSAAWTESVACCLDRFLSGVTGCVYLSPSATRSSNPTASPIHPASPNDGRAVSLARDVVDHPRDTRVATSCCMLLRLHQCNRGEMLQAISAICCCSSRATTSAPAPTSVRMATTGSFNSSTSGMAARGDETTTASMAA